jgi:carbon monoxide dehydrogenase subunit G
VFAYVSDFRHATWDPRVSEARRTDGTGPVGVGSAFELVSPLPVGSITFPYRIIRFEPPRRVTLEGQTWFARYIDDITFETDGMGTRLNYDAKFDLKGVLRLGGPLMQIMFRRVGDDATRGIVNAVVRGTA